MSLQKTYFPTYLNLPISSVSKQCLLRTIDIKHEDLRSRASKCLSLSSAVTDRYSKLNPIEILVLISWISHP